MNILEKANDIIHGERVANYGPADLTFHKIARAASEVIGTQLTAEDICKIFVIAKLIRDKHSPENPDHILDACGYLGIIGDIRKVDL